MFGAAYTEHLDLQPPWVFNSATKFFSMPSIRSPYVGVQAMLLYLESDFLVAGGIRAAALGEYTLIDGHTLATAAH